MNALICTCCGGKIIADVGNRYVCEYCRMEYTEERIKEMVVSGVVETTVGAAEKERLLKNAKYFTEQGNFDDAEKTYKKLLFDFPDDESVIKSHIDFQIKYHLSEIDKDKSRFAFKRPEDVKKCFELIDHAEKNGVDNRALKDKMHELFIDITKGNGVQAIRESVSAYEKISIDSRDARYKNFILFRKYIDISNKINTINENLKERRNLSEERKKLEKNLEYMEKSRRWSVVEKISFAVSGLLVILMFAVHFSLILGLLITIPLAVIAEKLSKKNRSNTGFIGGNLTESFSHQLREVNKKESRINEEEKLMQELKEEREELKKKYDNT